MRYSLVVPRMIAPLMALVVTASALSAQVTVAGVGFTQFGYGLKTDSSLSIPGHANNFDVTRAYVNVLGKFANGVQTRVTFDVDGRKALASQLSFRLKYAFVGWTPGKGALTYKMGLFTTPQIDWEEALWDYRFQGTIPVDRNGMMTSSDFGFGADGMWNHEQVNMQVGVFNGEGYGGAPGDAGKDLEGRVSIRLAKTDLANKVGGVRLTGYGQVGKASGGGSRSRFLGMLSYKRKAVTLAAEYGMGQDSTGVNTPSQKRAVMSAYGVFNIPNSKAAVIARVDSYDPNTDSTSTAKNASAANRQTRVIGGVSYAISPNLRVLLDLDLNSLQNGSTNSFDKSSRMVFFHTEFKF